MPQMLPVKKYHVEFIPFLSSLLKNLLRLKNPLQLDLLIFQSYFKRRYSQAKETFSCPNAVFFLSVLTRMLLCVSVPEYITLLSSRKCSLFLLVKIKFSSYNTKFSWQYVLVSENHHKVDWKCRNIFSKLPKVLIWSSRHFFGSPWKPCATCNVQNHDFGHCCFGTCTCELFYVIFMRIQLLNN